MFRTTMNDQLSKNTIFIFPQKKKQIINIKYYVIALVPAGKNVKSNPSN